MRSLMSGIFAFGAIAVLLVLVFVGRMRTMRREQHLARALANAIESDRI